MKMTDQIERDCFDAEFANGRAGRKENFDAEGLRAASLVIGVVLFGAILMIWLGR